MADVQPTSFTHAEGQPPDGVPSTCATPGTPDVVAPQPLSIGNRCPHIRGSTFTLNLNRLPGRTASFFVQATIEGRHASGTRKSENLSQAGSSPWEPQFGQGAWRGGRALTIVRS